MDVGRHTWDSISGVQVQYSELRTDGWTHLHNTLICCKAAYGNHARRMCRKHAATDLPETNSEGTAGRQLRRTDRMPAGMNRPGSGREQPTGLNQVGMDWPQVHREGQARYKPRATTPVARKRPDTKGDAPTGNCSAEWPDGDQCRSISFKATEMMETCRVGTGRRTAGRAACS